MSTDLHPFIKLRRAVRQCGAQYRSNNDNSSSLFNPEQGFIYAYKIAAVEEALDDYERTLPVEFHEHKPPQTLEEQVMEMGHNITQGSKSMEARDFARTVLAYMASKKADESKRAKVLSLLANLGDGAGSDKDEV